MHYSSYRMVRCNDAQEGWLDKSIMTYTILNIFLHIMQEGWLDESIMVFEGDFTDPNDKAKLVDAVMAIWVRTWPAAVTAAAAAAAAASHPSLPPPP